MKHARIPLSGKRGADKFMLVDIDDVELVSGIRWHMSDNGYAMNRKNGTTVRAHRLIMRTPVGMDTDHINHDKLDNRKSNLRVCTRSENLMNRTTVKGYYYSKKRDRWIVDCKGIGVSWKQLKTEQDAIDFVASRKNK